MKKLKFALLTSAALLLAGCVSTPEGVTPVKDFELQSYLGKWYEIARLDHRFERGMTDVTAQYSLRDDGGVKVLNSGYKPKKGEREEAVGKAYFVEDENTGFLKVSFFGPFYGSYIVYELGPKQNGEYQYSMVSGPNTNYLWLLSRTPTVPESLLKRFKQQASNLGFNTAELIVDNQPPGR